LSHKFLIHHIGDSVGVAIADISADEAVQGVYLEDDSTILINSKHDIPLGHKIALEDITKNSKVIEYRVPIGIATEEIKQGSYVHTHNLKTARW